MGFWESLSRSKQVDNEIGWINLTSPEQIKAIIEDSRFKPVLIFKHSTSCGISAMAKHTLEQDWSFEEQDLDMYYLDLLSYRRISNKVAEVFEVVHQSPQIILVRNGRAVFNTSHHNITMESLQTAVEQY